MPSSDLESRPPLGDDDSSRMLAESGIPRALSTPVPFSQVVAKPLSSSAWETLIDSLSHAMVVVGEDDGVLIANRAASELLGPELGVLVGRHVRECLSVRGVADAREALSPERQSYRYEERRFARGAQQVLEVCADLATGASGTLLVLTLRDVTGERREGAPSDEQLRQAQKMEALGQLTGGIVHDFNNLLAIIRGNLEIAQRRIVQGKPLSSEIERALQAAERGAALAQRLLAYSRQQRFEPWPTEVNELVLGLLDLVRRTLGDTIRVSTELADDLPEVLVDPIQLETALLNLALNSRDAMSDGGSLRVRTELCSVDDAEARTRGIEAGDYVRLTVEDTGCGIPESVLHNVLEPFYTTKSGKGSGLGLSMVHGFARQTHGTVVLRSTVGVGTSVELYLPACGTHVAPD